MDDFGDIDAVDYLDEVLNTPEAPQAAINDGPIPAPSHQPTVEKEYPYVSDISNIENIDSKSEDESSFFSSLPDR